MARWSILSRLHSPSLAPSLIRAVVAALVIGGLYALPVSVMAADETSAKTVDRTVEVGNTKPADQKPRELRFKNPGLLKTVDVKEGEVIKTGQLLMSQDDEEELAELDILMKDSSDLRIKAARTQAEAKRAEFERIEKIHVEASNHAEFEKAKAEADLAVIQIEQEKQDREVKLAKVEKQKKLITRMKLLSPMSGIVQSVEVRPGEMGEPQKPAITIVNNNPLIVEVNLPQAVSQKLKIDQTMRVSYDKKSWTDARVTYLAPFANAGAARQKVHLELPNPEGKVSGLQIFVELPDQQMAAK